MDKKDFLSRLEDIVRRSKNEEGYLDLCMVEDTYTLFEEYNDYQNTSKQHQN